MHSDKRDKPIDFLPQPGVFSARGSDAVLSTKNYRVRLSQALTKKEQHARIAQRNAALEETTVQRLRSARQNQREVATIDYDYCYRDGRETRGGGSVGQQQTRGAEQARKLARTAESVPSVSQKTPRRLTSQLESRTQDLQKLKKWNKEAAIDLAEGKKFLEGQATELPLHKAQAEELVKRVASIMTLEELRYMKQVRRPKNPYSDSQDSSKYAAWEDLNDVSHEAAQVMHNLSIG